jgi:hypothetical protein
MMKALIFPFRLHHNFSSLKHSMFFCDTAFGFGTQHLVTLHIIASTHPFIYMCIAVFFGYLHVLLLSLLAEVPEVSMNVV